MKFFEQQIFYSCKFSSPLNLKNYTFLLLSWNSWHYEKTEKIVYIDHEKKIKLFTITALKCLFKDMLTNEN